MDKELTSKKRTFSDSTSFPTTDRPGISRPGLIEIILWCLGLIILGIAAMIVHGHPQPWPVELSFTKAIQGSHSVPCVYGRLPRTPLNVAIDFVSSLNNPLPSAIALCFWVVVLLLLRAWRQAIFLAAAVIFSSGVFTGLGALVGRPRPGVNYGICVHDLIPLHSFPSGHVIHDVVFYGFLLYLSLSRPVREWRYRWLLLPLQILAALDILLIGLSRLLAGEHWLFDVSGGYLTGALCLFLFIFLYRWFMLWMEKRGKLHPGRVVAQHVNDAG